MGTGVSINGHEWSYWDDDNVLKHFMVMVAQLCAFTKNHWILKINESYDM